MNAASFLVADEAKSPTPAAGSRQHRLRSLSRPRSQPIQDVAGCTERLAKAAGGVTISVMGNEKRKNGDTKLPAVDPREVEEQHATEVRRIRESATYKQLEEALVEAIAVHARLPREDRVTFDEPLARQSIRVGVALASCGLMRAGSSRQRHLAQSTIDLCWERVPVFRAGKDDRAMAVLLARAAAWEIAITNIVHVGAFLRHLVASSPPPLSDEERGFAALRDLFQQLRGTATKLPRPLRQASDAFASATSMKDLPDDLQEATRSATAFLLGMRRENDEGEVVFRIGLHDLGGRGKGKKLGPWGAAKEIVAFFGVEMKDKMSEVA